MATITEILGTDSFSASRLTINANFLAINSEVGNFLTNFGISITSGNIDVSGATGGSISGKAAAFNTLTMPATGTAVITLNGTTGAAVLTTLTASTSVTTAALTITSSGTFTNQGTMTVAGATTFSGVTQFNSGQALKNVAIGSGSTYTVTPGDVVLSTSAAGTLTLSADPSLPTGYVVTMVSSVGGTAISITNVQGLSSLVFAATGYASSVQLMWVTILNAFVVVSSSNMTIT